MRVGYLPDMFGHVAQMPQLLQLFGFEHAVVWRGVPSVVDRTGFWWRAPDGSTVRAEYLPTGYGNGAAMPPDVDRFRARIDAWIDEQRKLLVDAPVLWMNGSDHRTAQPELPLLIDAVNDDPTGTLDVRITSLAEHLADAPVDGLPSWTGELRSGSRANLLMGVASNRVDVKQAAARAERALEQVAEPLATMLLPADEWPGELLDAAWREVIRNAAHDSICACSADEVVDAVLHRYSEARQIAEAIEERATRRLADRLDHDGPVVVNASMRRRSGLVTVRFPGSEPWRGTQPLRSVPAEREAFDLPREQALAVLPELVGWTDDLTGVTFVDGFERLDVILHCDGTSGELPPNRSVVAAALEARATGPVRAVVRRHAAHDALVHVDDVPASGWTPVASADPVPLAVAPVRVTGSTMTNGLVTVEVDERTGTFALDGHRGLGRLVDDGDAGDTYNYCPPMRDIVVDTPSAVVVRVLEEGPLRARVEVDAAYPWPQRVDDRTGTRTGDTTVRTTTTLEVHAGDPFVRVTVGFVNTAEDHRLRAWFPLPEPADHSEAECAFTIVSRGLTAEGGPTEAPMATFPSRRFVRAGGLTIAHEGLLEYELVDLHETVAGEPRAHSLALTLLRATRYLSRGPMATRPLPAGPVDELRGSQSLGRHDLRYAVSVADVDPHAMVEDAFVPLRVVSGGGHGDLPAVHEGLAVDGAPGAARPIVTAVRRVDGEVEVRAFNPSAEPVALRIAGASGRVVDLNGGWVEPFHGELELAPHRIATLRLSG
jgi:alpha-mannosidase